MAYYEIETSKYIIRIEASSEKEALNLVKQTENEDGIVRIKPKSTELILGILQKILK